jgi:hypothetical protein
VQLLAEVYEVERVFSEVVLAVFDVGISGGELLERMLTCSDDSGIVLGNICEVFVCPEF